MYPPTAAAVVGGRVALEATPRASSGLPISEVSAQWSSSDEAVAAADQEGRVEARALGTAVITAEARGESATTTVEVIEEEFVAVTVAGDHVLDDLYAGSGAAAVLPSGAVGRGRRPQNAACPVMSCPRISPWMSWVPS